MSARTPQPLRGRDGKIIAQFAGSMPGGLVTGDGTSAPGGPTIDALVDACPYRTLLTQQYPAMIGTIWLVPDDDSKPPRLILEAMMEEASPGRAILLLRRTPRPAKAKQFIVGVISITVAGRSIDYRRSC
jgi:hypothetical protein